MYQDNLAEGMILRLLCKFLGHHHYMNFHQDGVYWCWSAGGYDCLCKRCSFHWEETIEGQEALMKSQENDPRIPQFMHDCNKCQFLGRYHESDLYVCARDGVIDTVIYRFGSEGPEYGSGLIFAQRGIIPELVEALKRAKVLGLKEGIE